ncbi:CU044_2847 family protein [Paraburkholderia caffeinilytica]|uniref:CU044_2847 family protein n=1 Tax=Paraburkholderia caffeinilytica TaxID=1761016 RepID=UPI0038B8283C
MLASVDAKPSIGQVSSKRYQAKGIAMKVAQFKLDDGQSVLVEIDSTLESGTTAPASSEGPWVKAKTTFNDAMKAVQPLVEQAAKSLEAMQVKPESYEVEFGVKLSASLGMVVAKGESEANFKIKMVWKTAKV